MQRIYDSGKLPEECQIKNICCVCGSYEDIENPVLFTYDNSNKNWYCSNCYCYLLAKRIIDLTKLFREDKEKTIEEMNKIILTGKQIEKIEKLKGKNAK